MTNTTRSKRQPNEVATERNTSKNKRTQKHLQGTWATEKNFYVVIQFAKNRKQIFPSNQCKCDVELTMAQIVFVSVWTEQQTSLKEFLAKSFEVHSYLSMNVHNIVHPYNSCLFLVALDKFKKFKTVFDLPYILV